MKSTVDQIRERFDNDVERFSNLETGQSATIDAPLVLDLIAQAASTVTPQATSVLDIGCGAGNYTLKVLQALAPNPKNGEPELPDMDCTLVDLSRPMLDRAAERVSTATSGVVTAVQGDVREIDLGEGTVDVILAAAVLHHLRTDDEWRAVFAKFHTALRPGGSIWISDLITHTAPAVQEMMWRRYGEYLAAFKGEEYRDSVFAYIDKEDTPAPLMYQIDLLREVGFRDVELLHKNSVFAAFGAVK
jgi:tRNA (cmo5U34)-methyltransferase